MSCIYLYIIVIIVLGHRVRLHWFNTGGKINLIWGGQENIAGICWEKN